jgi:hypothetical protein
MLKSSVLYAIADTFDTREEKIAAYSAISSVTSELISELAEMYSATAREVARYLADHIDYVQYHSGDSIINVWMETQARELWEGNTGVDPYNNTGRLCNQPFDMETTDCKGTWAVLAYLGRGNEGSPEYSLFNFRTGEYRIAAMATMSNLY